MSEQRELELELETSHEQEKRKEKKTAAQLLQLPIEGKVVLVWPFVILFIYT